MGELSISTKDHPDVVVPYDDVVLELGADPDDLADVVRGEIAAGRRFDGQPALITYGCQYLRPEPGRDGAVVLHEPDLTRLEGDAEPMRERLLWSLVWGSHQRRIARSFGVESRRGESDIYVEVAATHDWQRSPVLCADFEGSASLSLWSESWGTLGIPKFDPDAAYRKVTRMPRMALPAMLCRRPIIGSLMVSPFGQLAVEWLRGQVRVFDTLARRRLEPKKGSWLTKRFAPGFDLALTERLRAFLGDYAPMIGESVARLGADRLAELLFVSEASAERLARRL